MKATRLILLLISTLMTAASYSQVIYARFMYAGTCGSTNVQFVDSSYAYPGTLTSWQWNFGDPSSGAANSSAVQNPSHVFINPGVYNVKLKVSDNLGNHDSTVMQVFADNGPVLSYPPLASVCSNSGMVSVATAVVLNGVTGSGYYRGTGTGIYGDFNPQLAGPGLHVITFVYTSTGGCTDSVSQTIAVNSKPAANFTFNSSTQCVPAQFVFVSTSTAGTGSTYLWDFNDGSQSTTINPMHTYVVPATYTVKLKVMSGGCSDSTMKTVTVTGPPVAGFMTYWFDSLCFKNTVAFSSTSSQADNHTWDFGDLNSGTGGYVYHLYNQPGTYQVTLVASNSCGSNTLIQTVTVVPDSKAIKPAVPGTLAANRQCDADSGWTNYYFDNNTPSNTADDTLLLSLKLNGNYIGKVNDGIFQLKLSATPGAGSNTGILLNNPLITNPSGYWVMNRYWNVQPAFQPTTPVGVRFYFNTQDLNDVNGSYPSHNLTYNDLIFYKTKGGNPDPTTNLAGATAIYSIMNGAVPDTLHWVYAAMANNSHRAEFAVSHFSGGGGGATGNLQSLPLKLVSFDAQRKDAAVTLKWITSDQMNVALFEVQRSADGVEFIPVGKVAATRDNPAGYYTFTDRTISRNTMYYRLKISDRDGSFAYSVVRRVAGSALFDMVIYPNPVKDILTLQCDTRENIHIEILDAEGKVLRALNTATGGSLKATLNMASFHPGIYLLKLVSAKGIVTRRFMKS